MLLSGFVLVSNHGEDALRGIRTCFSAVLLAQSPQEKCFWWIIDQRQFLLKVKRTYNQIMPIMRSVSLSSGFWISHRVQTLANLDFRQKMPIHPKGIELASPLTVLYITGFIYCIYCSTRCKRMSFGQTFDPQKVKRNLVSSNSLTLPREIFLCSSTLTRSSVGLVNSCVRNGC